MLPGEVGTRTIELATGATTDVDLGCKSIVTIRALATGAGGATWVLGGCFELGVLSSVLWRIS